VRASIHRPDDDFIGTVPEHNRWMVREPADLVPKLRFLLCTGDGAVHSATRRSVLHVVAVITSNLSEKIDQTPEYLV